ncbi:MAG: hypothetical protein V4550_00295 [Gemmatimonadota bacterium]
MPDDARPPQVQTGIDRSAVERVLARAFELQSAGSVDPEGRLSETQLEALAKEVGLDVVNLRQALAEDRTRSIVTEEHGILASLYGGAAVSAQRTIRGTPAEVLRALDDWMQRQESLMVQRHFTDRIIWEARRDLLGLVRRAVSGRGHALARATSVSATVVAVDAARVVVRLDAQLTGHRTVMAQQNIAFGGASLIAGGILAALNFPLFAVVAPAALIGPGSYFIARGAHRNAAVQAQLVLEQVLDRLERREADRPPTLMSMLAAAVGGRKL